MKKWIAGKDLLVRWNITELDLYEHVRDGLQPYTELGQPDPPPNIARIVSRWKSCVRVIAKLEYIKKVPQNDEKLTYYKTESKRLKNEINGITDYSWRIYDLPRDAYKAKKNIESLLNAYYKVDDINQYERPEQHTHLSNIQNSVSPKKRPCQEDKETSIEFAVEYIKGCDETGRCPRIVEAVKLIKEAHFKKRYKDRTIHNWIKRQFPDKSRKPGRIKNS
jgi:hypothetical protein